MPFCKICRCFKCYKSPILTVLLNFSYELPSEAYCLDWQDDSLVYGHDLGVVVLTRFSDPVYCNNLPTEFQRRWFFKKTYVDMGQEVSVVRMRANIIAAAHPTDNTITVYDLTTEKRTKLGGLSGHSSYINSLDISSDGQYVVSTGDDRNLFVWENGSPCSFPLSGTGKIVKFWDSPEGDRVIVLEAVNKIRILDWKNSEWLLTIHPAQSGCCGPSSGSVKDIAVSDGDILALGLGWWKKYNLATLSGGCGYTVPSSESRYSKASSSSVTIASGDGTLVGLVSPSACLIYDPSHDSKGAFSLNYNLPVGEVTGIALRDRGDILAVANGKLLTLIRNTYLDYEQEEFPEHLNGDIIAIE